MLTHPPRHVRADSSMPLGHQPCIFQVFHGGMAFSDSVLIYYFVTILLGEAWQEFSPAPSSHASPYSIGQAGDFAYC